MKETVKDILSGNKEAFQVIMNRYAPGIRAYFASCLPESNVIDDLTQETFILSYQNLHKAINQEDLGPWIKGIARNKLLMYFRTDYKKQGVAESLKLEIIEIAIADIETLTREDHARIEGLHNFINKLPERSQEIILARYFTNETVINLAQRLRSSVSAMSSVIYRTKQILRDCVKQVAQE